MTTTEQERERKMADELFITPYAWRQILKTVKPSVFILHNAAWSAGYTVNGVSAR